MPIYEYQCEKCGNRFEVLQKFSDDPLTVHEGCGGAVERLISPPGLHFKGSGWYITDYKNSSGKSESKSDTKPDSKADSKPAASETKTESKPAETTKKAD